MVSYINHPRYCLLGGLRVLFRFAKDYSKVLFFVNKENR